MKVISTQNSRINFFNMGLLLQNVSLIVPCRTGNFKLYWVLQPLFYVHIWQPLFSKGIITRYYLYVIYLQ